MRRESVERMPTRGKEGMGPLRAEPRNVHGFVKARQGDENVCGLGKEGGFANPPLPGWLSEGMRDGSPHPRGQRRGGGAMGEARRDGGGNGRFANRPYQMVVRGNEGWVPASARTTEGRGSDGEGERWVREDNGGEGERWVEARRDGGGNGRFANRPYQMVVRGNEGWVPASARTTEGRGSDG